MNRNSSPSFAVGGVSWLNAQGEPTAISEPVPTGWRCFHCNAHFWHWRAARYHFGDPGERKQPVCVEQ